MEDAAEPDTLSDLLTIFTMRDKAALVEHCRALRITRSDLAHLIMASDMAPDEIGLRHIAIFQHHHPPHLALTDRDLEALGSAKVGPFEPPARKAAGKLFQMMTERRLFCGHMFYCPWSKDDWHLFYFDQSDASEDSHWEHGSHLHLMNMLTHPQVDPNELLGRLRSTERPRLGGSLHIRYESS